MKEVLQDILEHDAVRSGTTALPLRHPDFPDLPVAIDRAEGAYLQRVIEHVRPRTSIEIGCAYGVSALYICEALSELPHPARHILIDPFQSTQWRGLGVQHLREAGFADIVDIHEDYSEFVLPALLRNGIEIEFAFVDGRHTFDQVMVEFWYLNRMLAPGGVIVFDDADRRSVNRVIRHALTYPAYRVHGTATPQPSRRSMAGRLRRTVAGMWPVRNLVRADVRDRDWDLGIMGSCVAIQKVEADQRSSGWDRVF